MAEPNFRDIAIDAGCDEFILKPLSVDLLSSLLEKHLGKPQVAENLMPGIET